MLLGHVALDAQLEALALAHRGELLEAQAWEGAGHGLALRVEEFGLRHDVDDDSSHSDLPVRDAPNVVRATVAAGLPATMRSVGPAAACHSTGSEPVSRRNASRYRSRVRSTISSGSRTDVAVVCAGAKAILDLQLTLEYLETKGVPVLGYKTKTLPAFYSAQSPYGVDYMANSPKEIAEMMKAKYTANLAGGILIANPIPAEYSMDFAEIEKVILEAIDEADEKGIHGKDITPFLLDRIQQLTSGESLEANIMLVYSNARLAAEIAIEYSKI